MKMTIDVNIMKDMFKACDRDYFSWGACETLLDYYAGIDENIEFDPIAICCEWSEYGNTPCLTWKDFTDDYEYLLEEAEEYDEDINLDKMDKTAKCEMIMDILEDKTCIIRLENSVLIAAF